MYRGVPLHDGPALVALREYVQLELRGIEAWHLAGTRTTEAVGPTCQDGVRYSYGAAVDVDLLLQRCG